MRKITYYVIPMVLGIALSSIPAISFAQVSIGTKVGIGAALTDGSSSSVAANATSNASVEVPITITRTRATIKTDSGSTTTTTSPLAASVQTRVKTLINSDEKVDAVSLSPDKVSMTYREPAKLLGFIGTRVPVEATIAANGTATVHYPWYSFLFATNQAGLSIEAQGIANDITSSTTAASTSEFSLATQAQLLTSLHTVLSSSAR